MLLFFMATKNRGRSASGLADVHDLLSKQSHAVKYYIILLTQVTVRQSPRTPKDPSVKDVLNPHRPRRLTHPTQVFKGFKQPQVSYYDR